jgi:hypothetical protein
MIRIILSDIPNHCVPLINLRILDCKRIDFDCGGSKKSKAYPFTGPLWVREFRLALLVADDKFHLLRSGLVECGRTSSTERKRNGAETSIT